MKKFYDNIFAPATAVAQQAIAIIRLSGPDSHAIINSLIDKPIKDFRNIIHYRWLKKADGTNLDQVLIMTFASPHSFTGEDMVEINCHGSFIVLEEIMKLLINKHARLALKGEFMQRAYYNNKLSLLQADAVNNLIKATNQTSARIALNNFTQKRDEYLKNLQTTLLNLIANIEVNIDYPEYDGVGDLQPHELENKLVALAQVLAKIIDQSETSQTVISAIKTLIIGVPNVGKSSLLNSLLQEDKAIVSHIQGTTRDLVEGFVNIGDLSLHIIDSAGIRSHEVGFLEEIGIKKTLSTVAKADLVLVMIDASQSKLSKSDLYILETTKDKKRIIVLNKADLACRLDYQSLFKKEEVAIVSALKHDINPLVQIIKNTYNQALKITSDQTNLVFNSKAHLAILNKIYLMLKQLSKAVKEGLSSDLVSIDLQMIWNEIAVLTGVGLEETILDQMFRNYCLGK